jgi:hypothetical protein
MYFGAQFFQDLRTNYYRKSFVISEKFCNIGPRSDVHGRKLLLIVPFIGNLLSFAAYMLNYHFFFELPTLHLLWGSVVGLSGSYICLNLGLYGYLSDISTPEDRTMRQETF